MPKEPQYVSDAMVDSPYESPDEAWKVEAAYPLIDQSFREDWEASGMEDYDKYEEHKRLFVDAWDERLG